MWTPTLFATMLWLAAGQAGGLRIVVLDGEAGVNLIQQKTAVAPLVEVRDRNGLPVPGAVVTFTIAAGRDAAVTGVAQTVTVTTNAAGQAAMTAFTPVNTGALQIQVQASFQGQTAAATISQTNVLTAAQSSNVAAAGAGGGGGIGGLTVAGIVAGVGAGAIAGVIALGGEGPDADSGTSATGPTGTPGTTGTGTTGPTIDPAVTAAAGTYILQQINGSNLPALTVLSPPNACPGFTDAGSMVLRASPQVFEMTERSHNECRVGTSSSFASTNGGRWTLQGDTISFLMSGGQFNLTTGSLSGCTLTFSFDAPHTNGGNPFLRVSSTWRK